MGLSWWSRVGEADAFTTFVSSAVSTSDLDTDWPHDLLLDVHVKKVGLLGDFPEQFGLLITNSELFTF